MSIATSAELLNTAFYDPATYNIRKVLDILLELKKKVLEEKKDKNVTVLTSKVEVDLTLSEILELYRKGYGVTSNGTLHVTVQLTPAKLQ